MDRVSGQRMDGLMAGCMDAWKMAGWIIYRGWPENGRTETKDGPKTEVAMDDEWTEDGPRTV